jgi:pyruvate dehydrogenase E2 component (dihydrolipoamide acetyltransferase)
MNEIVMPRLSDSMEDGTVVTWLKAVGEEVALGEALVEIETDKATMTYESDVAGILAELVAAEGDTVPVGGPIARVETSNGSAPVVGAEASAPEGSAPGAPEEERKAAVAVAEAPTAGADDNGVLNASPLARRIARGNGIDLATMTGTGPGGRIVKADVQRRLGISEAAAVALPAAPAPFDAEVTTAKGEVQTIELSRLQQTVARRMAESKATVPHFYLTAEIDMTAAVAARNRLKEASSGPVPTLNDMVVRACALALRKHPLVNGSYDGDQLQLYSRINVGVAVAGEGVLVVPTVFDADRMGLEEIATKVREAAAKVRDGSITAPELSGGTFTVSNLGMFGVSSFEPVINPPQAAILGVGALRRREGSEIIEVTLACDHRIVYGADGARFLATIRELLEVPLALAL